MSRLRDRRTRHDNFYRQAKEQRYAARSVFKLEEIDARFKLLKPGRRVLDLGCRPGSWLQYASAKVGSRGHVVGLDRQLLDIAVPPNATSLEGDVLDIETMTLRQALPEGGGTCFHIVLSDMAPDTTGTAFTDQVRSVELFTRAMDLSLVVGCPESAFLGKIFMGEGFQETVARMRRCYKRTKTVRPKATRSSSKEVYLLGMGLKPDSK